MDLSATGVSSTKLNCCPVCYARQGTVHYVREMMLGTGEVYPYWECSHCDCLSLAEVPAHIGLYYPKEAYYSFQVKPTNRIRDLRDRIYLSRASFVVNWRGRSDLDVIRRVRLSKHKTLLEVGCGTGHLLADLRRLGYNARGIDPFLPDDISDEFGVRVERKTLGEVRGTYDTILFRHSLEHMPIDALRLARNRITDNGACVVCIPLIGWAWQHYRTNWAQLDAPRHFFLHSRKSFEILAANSGFVIERVVFDSNEFQFWASDCYEKDIPLSRATRPNILSMWRLRRMAASLNRRGLGDTAQFYLRPLKAS
jgi:SAM-dependent methyltransferase